jgi:hypothetical protein
MQNHKYFLVAISVFIILLAGCTPEPLVMSTEIFNPSATPIPKKPQTPTFSSFPTPTATSTYICLSTESDQIKLACYFYGAIIAYEYEVAHAKYTCENMRSVQNKSPLNHEEVKFVETYFDWSGLKLEQVNEQNTVGAGKWYQLQFEGITGTIYHNLFIEDFDEKPCISLEKTIGLPIPTPQEP